MEQARFSKVLEPISIGSMQQRNRFVMPPMVTNYADEKGAVTERLKRYLQARARGGAALIMTEAVYVSQAAKGFQNQLGIHKDELIPGLKELTDSVHPYGAKIAAQLYHAGRQTNSSVTGLAVVAPSRIPCPVKQEMPTELTVAEIKEIVSDFRQAARRAKEAGFDAAEIHGAHGYLLNQFFSPYSNKRTDEYGGSYENRMRFPLEVVKSVREEVGEDFPILYRLSSAEFVEGGLTIEDTKVFAQVLVEAGINALHVSGGVYESSAMIIPPAAVPQGVYAENAAAIKKAIDSAVPVMVVGRIKSPWMAEKIIAEGKADLVAMGRALLGDPNFPNRVAEGRTLAIRRCIGCNQGCIDRLFQDKDIACMINPVTGHEEEYEMAASVAKRKVLVIGGGPGGLEAARIAALRGHETILYEKEAQLGGQLIIAAKPPHKDEINDLISYLTYQVEAAGVRIIKRMEADLSTVRNIKPDVVILATGAEEIVPNIPGIFQKNVVTAHEVLKGAAAVGEKVVVMGGGIALDVGPLTHTLLLKRLADKKIKVLSRSKIIEIAADQVRIEEEDGVRIIGGIETVVVAAGTRVRSDLAKAIKQEGFTVYTIGDAVQPRGILEAIHEGFRMAFQIGMAQVENQLHVTHKRS